MPYQSFPWSSGDSESFEKLRVLNIPSLKGKSFLDVGCNEGFFCGYAKFLGADKVVGVDINSQFVNIAKRLFPDCEFICQSWDELGPELYDAILNASAIHYASDQEKFLDLLMSRLKPGGTLILEIGVAPGEQNEFVETRRSIDVRKFPTERKLLEMLKNYSYKYIGQSVPQVGDPLPRHVYHISHKLPYAILLLDNPYSGKTFVQNEIFKATIKRISGDALIWQAFSGERRAPEGIQNLIKENFSSRDCGYVTYLICKNGLVDQYCEWICEIAKGKNFIFDGYFPASRRAALSEGMERAGYYVVNVSLQKAVSRPREKEKVPAYILENYRQHLVNNYIVDEKEYLEANPDVAKAVRDGKMPSGQFHYIFFGRKEGRKRSVGDDGQKGEAI